MSLFLKYSDRDLVKTTSVAYVEAPEAAAEGYKGSPGLWPMQ